MKKKRDKKIARSARTVGPTHNTRLAGRSRSVCALAQRAGPAQREKAHEEKSSARLARRGALTYEVSVKSKLP